MDESIFETKNACVVCMELGADDLNQQSVKSSKSRIATRSDELFVSASCASALDLIALSSPTVAHMCSLSGAAGLAFHAATEAHLFLIFRP